MNIEKICSVLDDGGLVITPTDTVYGLMADASSEDVIKKVFEVKKRPFSKPLILLMDSLEMIKEYTNEISVLEENLINEYMPGLVTIILRKNDKISNLITANSDYVGIRIPDNENLLKVIRKLGRPVISTSANISDSDVITNIGMLDEEVKNSIDYIYDSGDIFAESSTIVKFEMGKIRVLRVGKLADELLKKFG